MIKDEYKYKLFGRFKGRKKINNSSSKFFDRYEIDLKKIDKNRYNILDIGSGSGENAIYLSNKIPESEIITCEIFEDGNINLLNHLILHKINNISLYQGNAIKFLDILKKNLVFNEIWILFPDPWPKLRHHKRRLINEIFLRYIYWFIKEHGKLMIASDSQSYISSIINLINKSQDLYSWSNQSVYEWNYDLLDLPKTKFNKKAIKSSRKSMFFELNKI